MSRGRKGEIDTEFLLSRFSKDKSNQTFSTRQSFGQFIGNFTMTLEMKTLTLTNLHKSQKRGRIERKILHKNQRVEWNGSYVE
jgi:hypothetical protein